MSLHKRLEAVNDTEKALKELRHLKTIEFPDLYNPALDQTVETLLQQRNKKLEGEIVSVRNAYRESQSQIEAKNAEISALINKTSELEKLVTRYEDSAAIAVVQQGAQHGVSDGASVKSVHSDRSHTVDSTVITVLTNQRDRLKQQKSDLEDVPSSLCGGIGFRKSDR